VADLDRDLVLAKVSTIRKCVSTVRELRSGAPASYPAWVVQDVTVLNIQRAAQACLDLAAHVIAAHGWELPRSGRHAFEILAEHAVIDPRGKDAMAAVMGFRNVAVHQYADLDPAVVARIADTQLGDLEAIGAAILARLER
jgi:uncharacterized protein YutE (UPF0331/DUF86 family)